MESFQAAAASAEGRALTADVANFATGGLTVLVARADRVWRADGGRDSTSGLRSLSWQPTVTDDGLGHTLGVVIAIER